MNGWGKMARWLADQEEVERVQRRADYQAYLAGPEWAVVRRLALGVAGHRCQVCNSAEHLDVHHRTYERFGQELLSDLTVLCRTCHKRHHDATRNKSDAA